MGYKIWGNIKYGVTKNEKKLVIVTLGVLILIIGLILLSWGIYVGVVNNWDSSAMGTMTIIPGSILTFIGFVMILLYYYLNKR